MSAYELLEMFEDEEVDGYEDDALDEVEELADYLSDFEDEEIEEALLMIQERGGFSRMARRARSVGSKGSRRFKRSAVPKSTKVKNKIRRNKKKYIAGGAAAGAAGGAYAYRSRKQRQ